MHCHNARADNSRRRLLVLRSQLHTAEWSPPSGPASPVARAVSARAAAENDIPVIDIRPFIKGGPNSRRREFCHFAGIPSPSVLKQLLTGEGGCSRMTVSPTARPQGGGRGKKLGQHVQVLWVRPNHRVRPSTGARSLARRTLARSRSLCARAGQWDALVTRCGDLVAVAQP